MIVFSVALSILFLFPCLLFRFHFDNSFFLRFSFLPCFVFLFPSLLLLFSLSVLSVVCSVVFVAVALVYCCIWVCGVSFLVWCFGLRFNCPFASVVSASNKFILSLTVTIVTISAARRKKYCLVFFL